MRRGPTSALNDSIRALMARPCGVTVAQAVEATGAPAPDILRRLSRWSHEGVSFHSGGTSGRPYFATAAERDAWVAANPLLTLPDRLLLLIQEAGKAGAYSAQLTGRLGATCERVAGAATRLFKSGRIQMREHKGWRLYWAAEVEITDYAEMVLRRELDAIAHQRSKLAGATRWHGKKPAPNAVAKPKPGNAAPVIVRNPDAGKPQGEADMSRARITVCPTPRGRFEPEPGFVGAFSLVGIGRSVATGGAWA